MTGNDTTEATLAHAADWFERLQNTDMDLDSINEWQRWLAQRPEHRAAFNKCQDLWQRLDRVPAPPLPSREEMGLGRTAITLPRWALAAGIACLVLAGAALLGSLLWNHNLSSAVYETATAQNEQATFPDGSRLTLGAKSLVWTRFAEQERAVTLERGEAYFEVAPDKERPFVVRAGPTVITVLGTAFNVRRTGERLLVAVTEGRVSVGSVRIEAGQQLTLEHPDDNAVVTDIDPTVNAWRSGRLAYRGEPLKYVIADVNRYLTKEAVIADPEVGELLVTGTLFADDVQAWLSGLGGFLPVYVDTGDGGRVVLRRR